MLESTSSAQAAAFCQAVKHDVDEHTYLAPLSDFLDRFFPNGNEGEFGRIFETLKGNGVYKDGKWQGLPSEPSNNGADYCEPFLKILNSVVDKVEGLKHIKASWLDTSLTDPTLSTSDSEKIRPNCTFYTGDKGDVEDLKRRMVDEYAKLMGERGVDREPSPGPSTGEKRGHSAVDEQQTDLQDPQEFMFILSPEICDLLRAAWVRTMAVLEINPDEPDGERFIQAVSYKRRILRSQQDRMFVFSFILFHRHLSLWYSDRSGLLGAETMIDIDKLPLEFIRVFAGLATMTPEQLGFNPYMKRLVNGQEIHSYDARLSKEEATKSPCDIHWNFTVPLEGEKRLYQSVCSINRARLEAMCGHATLVWNVFDVLKKKRYVLKAYWRPIEEDEDQDETDAKRELPNASLVMAKAQGREIEAYELMGGGGVYLGKLVEAFDLPHTQTLSSFRKGLVCESFKEYKTREQRRLKSARDEPTVHVATSVPLDILPSDAEQSPPVDRRLCWMLFETIGWPVKHFLDLRELLTTIRDAVTGYERLFNCGIVHRDFSIKNIIIELKNSNKQPSPTETSGSLINLDQAKLPSDDHIPINLFEYLDEKASARDEDMEQLDLYLNIVLKVPQRPSRRLAVFLLETSRNVVGAGDWFQEQVASKPNNTGPEILDFKDVGFKFNEDTCIPPKFKIREAGTFVRGTLPFMSGMLFGENASPHSAVHDMESVFWILLYLCLTTSGPGGNRRGELDVPVDDESRDLEKGVQHLAYCFFDGKLSDVVRNKQKLLNYQNMDLLQPFVLEYFHPYFNSLKPLIIKLKNILINGYREMAIRVEGQQTGIYWQYPVAAFLHAIEEELANISGKEPQSPAYSLLREKEKERRQRDIDLFGTDLIPNDIPNDPLVRPSIPTNTMDLGSLSHLAHDPGSSPSNLSTRQTHFDSSNTTPFDCFSNMEHDKICSRKAKYNPYQIQVVFLVIEDIAMGFGDRKSWNIFSALVECVGSTGRGGLHWV